MSTTSDSPARAAAKAGGQSDVKSASKQCKLKSGTIAIVPVRYALDDVDESTGKQNNPLPSNEPWHPPFKIHHSFYTLRQLRDGWLYVYSEQNKTLHEYQVSGADLIKYDWGTNAPNQTPDERGTPGVSATYIEHSVKETLYLAFAHQRWTWRICEHMRSDVTARNQWMRRLSLGHYHATMEHQHTADISLLGERVADISSASQSVPLDAFSGTCTPLSPLYMPDDSSTNVEEQLKTDVDNALSGQSSSSQPSDWHAPLKAEENDNLVAPKAPNTEATYTADLDKQSALFVALDDVLADTSDSFLLLSHEWITKEAIMNDEDNIEKLQMAGIARGLGRVRIPEKELPEQTKNDIASELQFENDLTDYLELVDNYRHLRSSYANQLSLGSFSASSDQDKATEAKRKQIKKRWNYEIPSSKNQLNDPFFEQNSYVAKYAKEIRWNDLDQFIITITSKVKEIDKRITDRHSEFLSVIHQLGVIPFRFGIDTENVEGHIYLAKLTYQFLVTLLNTAFNNQQLTALKQAVSQDSPQNLLAIANAAFSVEVIQAYRDLTTESTDYINVANILNLTSRLSEFSHLFQNPNVTQTKWFQKLTTPIQKKITAFREAATGQSATLFNQMFDMLFTLQSKDYSKPEHVLVNIRLLLAKFIMTKLTKGFEFSKTYLAKTRDLTEKIKVHEENFKNKSGKALDTPENISHKQQINESLSIELANTKLIKFDDDQYNAEIKKYTADALKAKFNASKELVSTGWDKIEGFSGIISLLNIINLGITIQDIREQWPAENINEKLRTSLQFTATVSWTVSSVADIFKGRALSKTTEIATKKLLYKSIKDVINDLSLTSELKSIILKNLVKSVKVFAIFGLVASGFEFIDSMISIKDSSESTTARYLYGIKGAALFAQFSVFGWQLFRIVSRTATLGELLAPGLLIEMTVFWSGIIYLVISILILAFKNDFFQKWLVKSYWGIKKDTHYDFKNQMLTFLDHMFTPSISLNASITQQQLSTLYQRTQLDTLQGISVSHRNRLPIGYHYRLTIDFPNLTHDITEVGLKIICSVPAMSQNSSVNPQKQAKVINESKGAWSSIKHHKNNITLEMKRYTLEFDGLPATQGASYVNKISIWVAIPVYIGKQQEYCYFNKEYDINYSLKQGTESMIAMSETSIKQLTNRELPTYIPIRGL